MATPDYLKSLQNLVGNAVNLSSAPSPSASASAASALGNPNSFSGFVTSASAPPPQTSNKKLKFLLVSTHCHQYTGYSKVSYGLLKQLAKVSWLSVTHFGFQKFPNQQFADGFRPYPPGVELIDAAAEENPFEQGFGFKQLPDAIKKVNPDVIMIYNDMSIVGKFLLDLDKVFPVPRSFKTWVYCDQVYNTQLQGYLDMLNMKAERIFAFTAGWKQCLKEQGVTRPIDVILHGFESDVYKPLPRNEIRKQLKIPEEGFVYLNVNRNQPRKRYDIMVMAFAELVAKYPTKPIFLMCICDKGDKGGWWIFELYQRELKLRGVNVEMFANRLMLSSQDMVFKDDDINVFYNLADVGVNSADGEGWGLCNFEQMGVGVPQVVPKLGGFKEFCNAGNSVLVEAKQRYYLPMVYSPVGGEACAMDPSDLCIGMEEYLMDSDKRKAHGEAARKTVLGYTWERAAEPLIRRLRQEKEDKEAEADS
jgi:glycosyltransferase involved in cell wall biosynthesis